VPVLIEINDKKIGSFWKVND